MLRDAPGSTIISLVLFNVRVFSGRYRWQRPSKTWSPFLICVCNCTELPRSFNSITFSAECSLPLFLNRILKKAPCRLFIESLSKRFGFQVINLLLCQKLKWAGRKGRKSLTGLRKSWSQMAIGFSPLEQPSVFYFCGRVLSSPSEADCTRGTCLR